MWVYFCQVQNWPSWIFDWLYPPACIAWNFRSKIADQSKVVALYDFDPTKIDWPFNRQKPLALSTGQVVEIVHDDGSEWALGHLAGVPETLGYFPKNYTVSVGEYQAGLLWFKFHMFLNPGSDVLKCLWLASATWKVTGAMDLQEMMRDFENQEQQDGDEDEADQVLSCKIKSSNPITDVPKGSQVSPTIPHPLIN